MAYKKEEANIRDKNIKIIIVCNGGKFKYKSTSYVKKAIHKRIRNYKSKRQQNILKKIVTYSLKLRSKSQFYYNFTGKMHVYAN